MNYFGRLVSGIKGYYSEINSATLTGAIDIIVVRQVDGSFVGSPFHVRFGKIGVLRSREKVVDICINDEPVDLQMKLGEAGEAFFVEPCEEDVPHYLCTSPICDAESLMSEGLKKLKKEIKENEQEQFDSDSQHGSSVISTNGSAKELRDSDNDSFGDGDMAASQGNEDSKRTSLVQRSANISVPGKRINQRTIKNASHLHLNDFYPLSDLDSPLSTPDRQSPSNTDLSSPLRYSSDTEVNYQSELAASKDISSNQMTWNWGRLPQGLDAKPSPERKQLSEIKKEPKKQKHKSSSSLHKDMKQGMYLEDLLSVDQEVANLYLQQAGPHRKNSMPDQEDSDNVDAGVEATKSDVDITKNDEETTRTEEDTAGTEVDSFRKDEETAASDVDTFRNDGETAKSDSELNKSDGESGIGSSVSVSPDETKLLDSEPYSNIAISLCGELRRGKVSLERFLESVVPFEEFSKDPAQVLANPKLVVRIDDRYYNWNVAVPMLISHVVYQRPLPKSSVDALMKEHMPKKAKRRGYASWFSWRSPPEHNESTDEDNQEAERERWTKGDIGDLESEKTDGVMTEPLQQIPESNIEADMSSSGNENYKKVLELSSEQLASLNLKEGANEVSFSVTTKYQGTASCSASIFLYNYNDKIIISDIDGTITKSDVLGQILPATFWAQSGITKLFTSIQKNGYKFMYLSARPIGQAELTRQHLRNVVQENLSLPNGPLFLSPSSLIKAFHREVIEKKPEDFKIPCLRNIRKLFPPKNEPFFAGFGNRMNDVLSYRAVGIPVQRIFTVNHKGEVKNELTNAFQSSYTEMQELVDQMFPPCAGYTSLVASDEFSTFTYWRTPLTPLSDEQPLSNTLSAQDTETPS